MRIETKEEFLELNLVEHKTTEEYTYYNLKVV